VERGRGWVSGDGLVQGERLVQGKAVMWRGDWR
jgi:hypothetical protein